MCTLRDDHISNFVTKHLALLEEERKEECVQSRLLVFSSKSGVCLKHVTVFSFSSGLGGHVVVEFRSAKNNILQAQNLGYGDVVGVIEGTNLQDEPIVTGIVKFCKDESIGISVEDISNFNETDGTLYTLIKLTNDITYSRLKCALKALTCKSKAPGSILVDLLFGKSDYLEQMPISPLLLDHLGELRYVNNNLHKDQKEAVKFALQMKNLAIIHGPPGTGKTTTLVEVILQMVQTKNKILVCASSNIAVDNLVERLANYKVRMVRLGHPARVMESITRYCLDAVVDTSSSTQIVKDVRNELNGVLKKLKTKKTFKESFSELRRELNSLRKELQKRESRALGEVLQGSDVVLSTLVTSSNEGPLKLLKDDHFQCVVIDECSQALEAACWIAIPRASKVILAGDHLQLPPTILSKKAEQGGLGMSLMERMVEKFGNEGYRLLKCQFRMHKDIMTWSSNEMYGGQLEAHSSVADRLLKHFPHVNTVDETEMSLLFVDTADCHLEEETFETSRCNRGEAGIIAVLIKRLVAANVPPSSIAVITPYNYQVEMVRAYIDDLKGIEVRSVDGFQGREKDVILLSMVRSNPQRELGFLCDRRRLNVAVTRARRFLCVVGDSRTLSHDTTLASLIDYIGQNGVVESAEQYLSNVETPKEVLLNKKFQSSEKVRNEKRAENSKRQKKSRSQIQEKLGETTVKQKQETKTENCEHMKEDHYKSILQDFIGNSEKMEFEFPKSISAFDRKIIHQLASDLNLIHTSIGEGSERYIVVRKSSSSKTENTVSKSRTNVTIKDSELDDTSVKHANMQLNTITNVPKSVTKQSCLKADEKNDVKKAECKNSEKVNKKLKKRPEPEDFDSLIAEFQEMNKRCPWSGCKISTDLVGLVCVHCKKRFCISHGLPEVHGCGEAARKAARHEFRHPPPTKPDMLKRNAVSKKLEKKLMKMAEGRKHQKKET